MNDVLTLLLAAVLVVSIFRYLNISTIIGYLIAGLVIGPYAFAFISDISAIKSLAHFGVVFLLFSIGLNLPLQKLQAMKAYFLGLGSLQFFTTAVAIGSIAFFCNQTIEASILIGSALALSSTAVGLGVLAGSGEMTTRYGRISFAVLLFQDFVVIMLLVLLTTLGQPDVHVIDELKTAALKAAGVLTTIILMGRLILRPVYRAIAALENQELFVAMTLLVVLATSMTTKAFGLSMELGAFLAGLLLSETEYKHQVEADIEPFHGLLLGLFFMTVGMSIDLRLFIDNAALITSLVAAMFVGKTTLFFLASRLLKTPIIPTLKAGLLLAGGGEFVFVVLTPAVEVGILQENVAQILFAVVAISMGLTPFIHNMGKYLDKLNIEKDTKSKVEGNFEEIGDLKQHVIILGFGEVGKRLAAILAARMVPFVVIDKSMTHVSEGQAKGWPVFFGDARRVHVLRTLGAEQAQVIAVCLANNNTAMKTAMMAKRNFHNAEICVRMLSDEFTKELRDNDINVITPDNLEPSLQLASNVLAFSGTSADEVKQAINSFREVFSNKKSVSTSSAPIVE